MFSMKSQIDKNARTSDCKLLFLVAAAFIFCINGCGNSTTTSDVTATLQKVASEDSSESFRVAVFYRARVKLIGTDGFENWIDNLSFEVFRTGPGIGTGPFDRKFSKTWHAKNLATDWTARHFQTEFILPSGRVLFDKDNADVLLLFFSGEQMELMKLNRTSMTFTRTDPEPYTKLLKVYYAHAFDNDDVYWSYAIVRYSPFFGMPPSAELKPTDDVDIEKLFRYWNEIKAMK